MTFNFACTDRDTTGSIYFVATAFICVCIFLSFSYTYYNSLNLLCHVFPPEITQHDLILWSRSLSGVVILGKMLKNATTVQQVQPWVNSALYGSSVYSLLSLHNNCDCCSFLKKNVRNSWVSRFKNKKKSLSGCIRFVPWGAASDLNHTTLFTNRQTAFTPLTPHITKPRTVATISEGPPTAQLQPTSSQF